MNRSKTNTIKKVISWAVGLPAGLMFLGGADISDLRFWWVPFVAGATFIAILAWNGVFRQVESR